MWPYEGPFVVVVVIRERRLTSESVEGSVLSLKSIDDIHSCDDLPLGMFSVGDGISDDVFQENLQDSSGFFIDETRNSLHTTSTRKPTDGWLVDTLDLQRTFLWSLAHPFPRHYLIYHVQTLFLLKLE